MNARFPQPLISALRTANSIVILTGAGVSAESGIPTFRDATEGLWAKHNPAQLATPEAFERDPTLVTRWYDWRRQKCAEAKPNPAHRALAKLQHSFWQTGRQSLLVTQNVDRLHQLAGSRDVVELHGNLWEWRCVRCGEQHEERQVPFPEYPPLCHCGGPRRPCVVWFGEILPEQALDRACRKTGRCDLFLSVGTSALVYPAASLLHIARQHGAKTAEINRDATPVSHLVDWPIFGKAAEILPALVECALEAS